MTRRLRYAWRRSSAGARGLTIGLVLCAVAWTTDFVLSAQTPSARWVVGYGIAAAALLAATIAYAVRRRLPRRGPGTAARWLDVHIYSGVLFFVVMLMHSGFRLPGGTLGWTMWLTSFYLVASGLSGRLIQKWVPRLLTSSFTTEVNYERIPGLVDIVRSRVEVLVAGCDESVRRFYEARLAPALAGPRPHVAYLMDPAGRVREQVEHLDFLRQFVSSREAPALDEMKVLVASKFEMDAQYTLQRILRVWPYGHVPASLVLIAVVLVHVFSILYY